MRTTFIVKKSKNEFYWQQLFHLFKEKKQSKQTSNKTSKQEQKLLGICLLLTLGRKRPGP